MPVSLTNADIVSRLKLLADYNLKANSGSTTTAVNSSLVGEPSIVNSYICFINGNNVGIDAIITSFDEASGTCSFDAIDNAVTNTSEFCITKNGYLGDFEQASLSIANDFRNKGYDITLFLTSSQLKEMYIYKTIELICGGLMNDGDDEDAYFVNYKRFMEKYQIEQTGLIADYDLNKDGSISLEEEELRNTGQIVFSR